MLKLENLLIAFYGITTVAVFLIMVYFGGLFDSVHTLLFREISFLISPYSLTEDITVPLYRMYNINLLMFSLVLLLRVRNVFAKLGALYLSMSAVSGILLIAIPMDAVLLSRSVSGFTHILAALLTAFYIMVAMMLFGLGFKKSKNLMKLAEYSFELSIVMLLAGFFTAVFALISMPEYVGLFQKLPIAAFLLWIVLTAFWMLHSDRRVSYVWRANRKK